MTFILGVDPGLSGALAFYNPEVHTIRVADMPVHKLMRNGKGRSEIDAFGVARTVDAFNPEDCPITAAFIERVQSMPGQGVSSSFAFGRSTGVVIGCIAAHFITLTEVSPVRWQRALGIPAKSGKDMARQVAANLFPKQSELFARVKDSGRADAALIAVWGYKYGLTAAA